MLLSIDWSASNHGVGDLETEPADTPTHLKRARGRAGAGTLAGTIVECKQIFTPSQIEYIEFDEPESPINAVLEVYDRRRELLPRRTRNETNACAHDGTARRYDAANS
jgi:hypothetical protein